LRKPGSRHRNAKSNRISLSRIECGSKFVGKKRDKADKKEARKAKKQGSADGATSSLRRAPPTQEELARVGAHVDLG
jgi:hypothetical protein